MDGSQNACVEYGFHIDKLMKKYNQIVKRSCWIICFLIVLSTSSRAGDVSVANFGAKGDGVTMNSMAIQKAIDACNAGGGGKVIFPKGIYLSGTIELKDNVTLYLEREAKLLGSPEIEDYRNLDPFTEGLGIDVGWALVVAIDRKNIGIEGAGVIDGQGAKLKAAHILKDTRPEGQRWGRRPFLLRVVRCNGVRVKDITLNYAAAWTSHYFQSKNILIENVKIVSVGVAHNDGIGIDGSQDVVIRNCDVESGDDALVFKTTSSRMACRNIEVSDMRLKSNQGGIKMGTESMANFENITIRNCLIYDTKNGGIKLLSVDGAQIKNILISNIDMKNIRTPILLRLGSRLSVFRKGQDTKQSTGKFDNVVLKNIHAISADSTQLKSASGILITGVPDQKLSGVTLENIRIELPGGGGADEVATTVPEAIDGYPEVKTFGPVIPAYGLWARHAKDLNVRGLDVTLKKSDFRPAIVLEDVTQMELTGAVFPGNPKVNAVIDVRGSKDILIDRCKVSGAVKKFVNADAMSRPGIRLVNNILPRGVRKIN
jgi:polygalacturonase